MVENPGDSRPVTQFAENRQTCFVQSTSLRIVPLGFHNGCEVADGARNGQLVAELFPEQETLFKERGRRRKIAVVASKYGQCVQRNGHALLVLQEPGDLQALIK